MNRSVSTSVWLRAFLAMALLCSLNLAAPPPTHASIYSTPIPLGTSKTNPGAQNDFSVVWREGWGNDPLAQFSLTVPQPEVNEPAIVGAYYIISRPSSVATINASMWPGCYNAIFVDKATWDLYLDLPGEAASPGPYFNTAGWTPPAGVTLGRPYEGPYFLSYHFFAKDVLDAVRVVNLGLGLDMTPPVKVTGIRATPGYGGPLVNGWLTQSRVHLDWDDKVYDSLSGTGYFEIYMDGKPFPGENDGETTRRVYDLKEHYPGYGVALDTRRGLTIEDLPAGEHTFQVRAVDRATNEGPLSDPIVIKCDPDIPEVDITYPEVDGQRIGVKPTFTADVADQGGVETVEFYVDGVLKSTDSVAPFAATVDLGAFPDGSSHTLRVVARDVVGRMNFAESLFVIDKAPRVTIVSPSVQGQVLGSPALLSATASDETGISHVTFAVDGTVVATYTPTAREATNTVATALQTLPAGAHTLVVTAKTAASGIATATRTFVIDASLPVSTLAVWPPTTEPTPLQGTTDTNPYDPAEPATFWRELWGSSVMPQFVINSPSFAASSQVELFYSVNRAPNALIDPSDSTTYYRSVNPQGTMALNDIDITGILLSNPQLSGTALYPGRAAEPAEGVWFWHLLFRNASGEIDASYDQPFGIDRTRPSKVGGVGAFRDNAATVPLSSWINQDRLVVRWDNPQHDAMSGTAYYRLYVDGRCIVPGDVSVLEPTEGESGVPWFNPNRSRESLTLENIGPGKHEISITAVDRAGNESLPSTPAAAWLDPDLPGVTILRPGSGSTPVGASAYLSAQATDGAGVASIQFLIDGVSVGTVRPSTLSTDYVASLKPNWSLIPNGRRQLTVTVTDMVGRKTSAVRYFTLDRTAPGLRSVSVSPNPFFPLKDSWRDTARISFKGSGYTTVTLEVARPGSRPPNYKPLSSSRRWYSSSSRPRSSFVYNGTSLSGAAPLSFSRTSETRRFWIRVVLRDAAGNVKYSAWRELIAKTAPQLVKLGPDTVQVIQR